MVRLIRWKLQAIFDALKETLTKRELKRLGKYGWETDYGQKYWQLPKGLWSLWKKEHDLSNWQTIILITDILNVKGNREEFQHNKPLELDTKQIKQIAKILEVDISNNILVDSMVRSILEAIEDRLKAQGKIAKDS